MNRFLSNVFCNNFLNFLLVYFFFSFLSEASSETKVLLGSNQLHTSLEKIKNKKINNDSFELIQNVIEEVYDSEKMGKMIIGKNWEEINTSEREKFLLVFERFIVVNYLRRFSKINQLDFDHQKIQMIGNKFRLAKFLLKADNEIIQLDYLLHHKNKRWKIIDVIIEGSISEVVTKKADFNKIINEKGVLGLISNLELRNSF